MFEVLEKINVSNVWEKCHMFEKIQMFQMVEFFETISTVADATKPRCEEACVLDIKIVISSQIRYMEK